MNKIFISFIISFVLTMNIWSFKIDRVILSSDANPTYIQFWPMVAKAWKDIIGVKPTLALIADETVEIDESYGDVIRFSPLPDLPTSYQAQIIRLLLPVHFKDELCIISDIDMLPLSKEYFFDSVAQAPDDCFVVYRKCLTGHRYKMCYNAAMGKTFGEVFKINSIQDFASKMYEWYALNFGWHTDEKVLTKQVDEWGAHNPSRYINLGHNETKRIDREHWKYSIPLLKKGFYIDAHMLRPYNKFKKKIDKLLKDIHLVIE